MTRFRKLTMFVACATAMGLFCGRASADLQGGTYTNGGAPTTTWPAFGQISGSPKQYQSTTDPTAGNAAQGYPGQDASATGAILAEVVTPTTAFKLDTISVELAGAGNGVTGLSIHVFTLGSATTPLSALASSSGAFYFVNTDLLGGGAGLPFTSGGVTGNSFINFTLNNGTTNDIVTLAAGTSYAIELWDQSNPFSATALTWNRNSTADPNGQGFAKPNTTNTASRNTLAANGLAGGAPRTFQIALYGTPVPEPSSVLMLGLGVVAVLGAARRRTR